MTTYLVDWHLFTLSSFIRDNFLGLFSVVWRSYRGLACLLRLSIEIKRAHIGLVLILLLLLRLVLLRLRLLFLRKLGLLRGGGADGGSWGR
jgi:hypothetical protein